LDIRRARKKNKYENAQTKREMTDRDVRPRQNHSLVKMRDGGLTRKERETTPPAQKQRGKKNPKSGGKARKVPLRKGGEKKKGNYQRKKKKLRPGKLKGKVR